jgi:dTDP-4-dehydrorhamnose reductase
MWMVLGADGQLGRSLQVVLASADIAYAALNRTAVDITQMTQVSSVVKDLRPSVIVNAAAWTAVDAAEDNEDSAYVVNCLGAGGVAAVAAGNGARFVHISTDYVFSGHSSTSGQTTTSTPMRKQPESQFSSTSKRFTIPCVYTRRSVIEHQLR